LAAAPEFERFARREHDRLVGALTLYCGDLGVAEELAQDTLVRVRERWDRVSSADCPGAYARRIAINLANSRYRRRSAERRALTRLAGQTSADHRDPCGADGVAVRRAVAALPPRQREVVVRRYFLDESVVDVATAMGIGTGSVKSATHRALQSLRTRIDPALVLDVREESHDGS